MNMSAIDLAILGIVMERPQSAYEIQKDVIYHHFNKWTSISVPSVYKKVLRLEEQGYLRVETQQGEKNLLKSVYTITHAGEARFRELMHLYADQTIDFLFDFNAVVANLGKLDMKTADSLLETLHDNIKRSAKTNLELASNYSQLPIYGKTIFRQQQLLYQALLVWIKAFKEELKNEQDSC